jgi:hypothetical protein
MKSGSKKIKKTPLTTRTTRGVKLGDLSENAMAKKSYAQLKPVVVDDADYDNAFKI